MSFPTLERSWRSVSPFGGSDPRVLECGGPRPESFHPSTRLPRESSGSPPALDDLGVLGPMSWTFNRLERCIRASCLRSLCEVRKRTNQRLATESVIAANSGQTDCKSDCNRLATRAFSCTRITGASIASVSGFQEAPQRVLPVVLPPIQCGATARRDRDAHPRTGPLRPHRRDDCPPEGCPRQGVGRPP